MTIWSSEIKELETLYTSIKGQLPELEKELGQLIKTDDENVVMLYSRRCLEVIITDLCEHELKRPRKTEPLKGIIDKLHREEKVPPHIITSMQHLNSLSTFGAHPKDFDPEQVKPVLNNLTTIFKWYLKYKDTQAISKPGIEEVKTENLSTEYSDEQIRKPKKRLILLLSGFALVIVIVITALYVFDIIGGEKRIKELEKSIAVLPFKNLSQEAGNEYFVDGLVEDLLNRISVIDELRVISRTSSEMFRERGVQSVPEIARQLGVSYIVEGSVQRYGDRARVTVQLIDAINDDHIWADNYDRDLVDIFKTQSEIAMSIASELNTILTSGQKTQIQENRTINIKAFELYQMGRFYWNKRTGDGYKTSIEYFEKAIDEDSKYGLAYAGLADSYILMALQGWIDLLEGRDKAEELALKALELDENLAEAYTVLGQIYDYVDWDWEKAERTFQLAFEKNPNYATAHQYYSEHLSITGQHEEARKHIDKALELNPLSFVIRYVSAKLYYHQGRFTDALRELQKCQELQEDHPWLAIREFEIYWYLNEEEKSYEALKKIIADNSDYDLEEAERIYKESGLDAVIDWKIEIDIARAENGNDFCNISRILGMAGKDEEALLWLEKAIELRDCAEMPFHIEFKNLHDNPRYIALLKKMNLDE